jgi:hypothetical protein
MNKRSAMKKKLKGEPGIRDKKLQMSFRASKQEHKLRADFHRLFKNSPIPGEQILVHLALYLNRQTLSQLLFMHELYQQIINVHGVVMEFGPRWGRNLALFQSFRGIYEPFNHNRKIIGFDTFEGFPSVDKKRDGHSELVDEGIFNVTANYEDYLEKVLSYHERESPIPHLKKFEIVKGDVMETLPAYLKRHPETIVSLAYFDLDLYQPTKKCLQALKNHITRGTVLGFDELNYDHFPGETQAFREELGLSNFRVRRSIYSGTASYVVVE